MQYLREEECEEFLSEESKCFSQEWKCWVENPPKEGEHIVRRTISDMATHYSSKEPLNWQLIMGAFRVGGNPRYEWKPIENYLKDASERKTRGGKNEE